MAATADSGIGGAPAPAPAAPAPGGDATLLGTGTAAGGEASAETAPATGSPAPTAAPVVPERYRLAAPEGLTLDPADVAAATPAFREIGLTNDQAQALMPVAAAFVRNRIEQALALRDASTGEGIAAERQRWAEEARADAEIGGPRWTRSLAEAAKALDSFGAPAGSPFRALLDDSGLGNHPEMIRFAARIGRAIGEDPAFIRPDAAPLARRDMATTLYPDDIKGA